MELKNRKILVTGGASGIGLEIVKLLSSENKIIIVGRNQEKLQKAKEISNNITTITGDLSTDKGLKAITDEVKLNHSDLSVLINNAAEASAHSLQTFAGVSEKAEKEINTNYLSVLRLNEALLPVLTKQQDAAIVNVTSIVALTPAVNIPTYSASKAALRAYTQLLRAELAKVSSVKVFELMPPLVDTELSAGIGGKQNGIPPKAVAERLIEGIQQDEFEIHVARTKDFYNAFFAQASGAFAAMNAGR
ncbi:MAG: SDR family NAD(P)-dependent oxidoreductase [Bacteroidota bacterium]